LRVLLDTHALLWWPSDNPSLTRSARKVISETRNAIIVSAASAWEISTKFRLGRSPAAGDLVSDFPGQMAREGFELLPISAGLAIRAGLLPGVHKDPFDRMLVAQSQAEGTPSSATKPRSTLTVSAAFGYLRWPFLPVRTGRGQLPFRRQKSLTEWAFARCGTSAPGVG
jgi:PIN domain nuclease of toxin-antitoxin system